MCHQTQTTMHTLYTHIYYLCSFIIYNYKVQDAQLFNKLSARNIANVSTELCGGNQSMRRTSLVKKRKEKAHTSRSSI
jgi:hypothetical protein